MSRRIQKMVDKQLREQYEYEERPPEPGDDQETLGGDVDFGAEGGVDLGQETDALMKAWDKTLASAQRDIANATHKLSKMSWAARDSGDAEQDVDLLDEVVAALQDLEYKLGQVSAQMP